MVRDSFELEVPHDAADGAYRVRVQMLRQPHDPNLSLRDYLSDDDFLAGVEMGRLLVTRDRSRLPAAPAAPPEPSGH